MIIVCFTYNITLPRRRGSCPDGAQYKPAEVDHIVFDIQSVASGMNLIVKCII